MARTVKKSEWIYPVDFKARGFDSSLEAQAMISRIYKDYHQGLITKQEALKYLKKIEDAVKNHRNFHGSKTRIYKMIENKRKELNKPKRARKKKVNKREIALKNLQKAWAKRRKMAKKRKK